MASNLNAAKSLIQADLEHARNVLNLWTHQVMELERALEQIEAVGISRNALRVEYQNGSARSSSLDAPTAKNTKPKRGRKPKTADGATSTQSRTETTTLKAKRGRKLSDRIAAAPEQVSEVRPAKGRKTVGKNGGDKPTAKYKDPNSGKTWSGRGRRPHWFTGKADQYVIDSPGGSAQNDGTGKSEIPQVH